MNLRRDEIAFRKNYEALVLDRQLTTVFRPGDRIFPNFRGYKHEEIVTARIIEKVGCDHRETPPVFSDIRMSVKIVDIRAIDISALTPGDFLGSSPDIQNVDQLLDHLAEIYQRPISSYENKVTRIQLQYLPEVLSSASLSKLISA
ncbi:MAG: hypothetical protein JKY88_12045 [Pseudomonadales bacterium]|nr:hypothetical protein [Pseudomonadales bacterium]